MIKKISLLAVTAAAVALALTSCVKAPVSGLVDTRSLDGRWSFAPLPVMAVIEGPAVMVTVDAGGQPISMQPELAAVTRVVVNGTLNEDVEEETFTLTMVGDPMVTLAPTVPETLVPSVTAATTAAIKTMIEAAQKGTVMITLNTGPVYTMVVQGSFIDALLMAAGMEPSPMGLVATRIVD